jgi:DNA-binding transcriptional regulator YiaG
MPTNNPTPSEIRQARESAGLSTAEASALVHRTQRNWQQWESGARAMDAALWELFSLKSKAR